MVKSSELQKYLPRKTEHSYHQPFFWHRLKKYVNALCLHSSGQDNSTRDWHARNASETRIRGSRFSHVASRWFCSCQPLRLSPIVASLKFFFFTFPECGEKEKQDIASVLRACSECANTTGLNPVSAKGLKLKRENKHQFLLVIQNISILHQYQRATTYRIHLETCIFSVSLFQNMEKLEIVIAVLVLCLVALVVYAVTSWTLTRKKRRNADADSEKDAVPYKYLEEEAEHVRKKVATAYAQETMPRITITPVQPRPDFPKVRDGLNLLVTPFICIGGLSSGKRIYQVRLN